MADGRARRAGGHGRRNWPRRSSITRRPITATPTSEAANIRIALRPLLTLYAELPAAEFSPKKLDAVRQRMVAHGHCRAKVNHHVQRLRRMFRWGVEKELVPPAVLHGLAALAGLRAGRSAARETAPVAPVPEADVEATLPHLSRVVAAMVRLQRLFGMRPGEVCRMSIAEIERCGDVWLYRLARQATHRGLRPAGQGCARSVSPRRRANRVGVQSAGGGRGIAIQTSRSTRDAAYLRQSKGNESQIAAGTGARGSLHDDELRSGDSFGVQKGGRAAMEPQSPAPRRGHRSTA